MIETLRATGGSSIALADLVPELSTAPAAHDKAIHTIGFTAGLALLYTVTAVT